MSRIPIQELRRMGVSQEDIEAAQITQAAQRRNGSPVQSIGVIVGAVQPRARHNPNPPVSSRTGRCASAAPTIRRRCF